MLSIARSSSASLSGNTHYILGVQVPDHTGTDYVAGRLRLSRPKQTWSGSKSKLLSWQQRRSRSSKSWLTALLKTSQASIESRQDSLESTQAEVAFLQQQLAAAQDATLSWLAKAGSTQRQITAD
ncbi:TPA: hypothetical protein ACH3X1_013312 [Trebouxia sp. C0004]